MVALAATGFFLIVFFILKEGKAMATFAIEIPDEQVERILTAICANYQYDATISEPNSKASEIGKLLI